MKFLWIAVLACVAWKMIAGRWPWQSLGLSAWPDKTGRKAGGGAAGGTGAGSRLAQAEARTLLGVAPGADRKAVLEAHRRRLAAVHPDRGGSNEAVHAANAARDTLLAALESEGR